MPLRFYIARENTGLLIRLTLYWLSIYDLNLYLKAVATWLMLRLRLSISWLHAPVIVYISAVCCFCLRWIHLIITIIYSHFYLFSTITSFAWFGNTMYEKKMIQFHYFYQSVCQFWLSLLQNAVIFTKIDMKLYLLNQQGIILL